ncbi:uncharacterized protein TNCV_5119571 [Trichonephila clavipes]|nr:uncharacterized protein TNCV_5119571 [Trichonephila clavipes]
MIEAADEVRKLKNTSDVAECGVSVDGTWQRRGHSSLNGCVAVLSIDTGKVLDLEVMSKWCRNCNTSKSSEKVRVMSASPNAPCRGLMERGAASGVVKITMVIAPVLLSSAMLESLPALVPPQQKRNTFCESDAVDSYI